jgi:hypothetical protein
MITMYLLLFVYSVLLIWILMVGWSTFLAGVCVSLSFFNGINHSSKKKERKETGGGGVRGRRGFLLKSKLR